MRCDRRHIAPHAVPLLALVAIGCGSRAQEAPAYAYEESGGYAAPQVTAAQESRGFFDFSSTSVSSDSEGSDDAYVREAPARVSSAPSPAPPSSGVAQNQGPPPIQRPTPPPTQVQPQKQNEPIPPEQSRAKSRMVHYNGWARLSVGSAREAIGQAEKLAKDAGGWVETMTEWQITVRVPVARFREIYAQSLGLGDVLGKSMTAQDITDQYTAMDLRLRTLRASRDRFIELLGKTRNEHERLSLLQEIQRLTEAVDQLEMQLKTLASLASFSRLTLEMIAKQVGLANPAFEVVGAFRWVHNLSPFRRDTAMAVDELELQVPAGMVELDSDALWAAEGPDGTVLWASERDNSPEGDTAFWAKVIEKRLGPSYAKVETLSLGDFTAVRFVDGSVTPYTYVVAVRAAADKLQVVESYFPSATHEARFGKLIQDLLSRGGAS